MHIKDLKKIGVKNLVLLLVAGVALLLFSVPGFLQQEEESKELSPSPAPATGSPTPTPQPSDEERLRKILSEIAGVGAAEVMIFYQSSEETVVLQDENGTVMTSVDGASMPYVSQTRSAVIEGILIVAEGGSHADTVRYISDAVEALFGIPKHKIIVLPMKNKNGSK